MVMLCSFLQKNGMAQDIIVFKNGDELKTKVTEVTNKDVKYKKFTKLNGPIFISPTNEISMIKYENGETEIFKEISNPTPTDETAESNTANNNQSDYARGYTDGLKNFKNYRAAGTGTFVTTLIGGSFTGLVPAIACSYTKPPVKNLALSSTANEQYIKGYQEGARKRKARKVWTNYGIAMIPRVGFYVTALVVSIITEL